MTATLTPEQVAELERSGDSPSMDGLAMDIELVNNRAFVASGSGGVHAIDISVPAAPTWLGSLATSDSA